ncbi:MAG: ATP-dependent DNA helicase [Acidobacteria bacterium]|nr:ATP-dependent DNA helicase [Acidobacteriota bacterium]
MPEVPAVPRTAGLKEAVAQAFSGRGALARVVDGYEPRDGQRRMAEAVAAVIERGGTLLAEAGTGTGKTLAYLIPAILSRDRVLVSTGTKNLQEQIYFKDLPALQAALGVPFTATLMKGRSNYLCLHRWELHRQSSGGDVLLHPALAMIDDWARTTKTGDRAELRDLPEDLPFWKDIAAEAETCLGSNCPRYDDCFVTEMRRRAASSDVVIVNHHLLCADASVRQGAYGEVIPPCPTLVIDEAHQLEDVATQYFGYSFSDLRVEELARDGERLLSAGPKAPPCDDNAGRGKDSGGRGLTPRQIEEIQRALTRVAEHGRTFFSGLATAWAKAHSISGADLKVGPHTGAESKRRYTAESLAEHLEDGLSLVGALDGLEATIALALRPAAGDPGAVVEANEAFEALQRRVGELRHDLRFLLRAGDPDFVYYLEVRGRRIFLKASPVDVSRIVRETLFDRMRAAVLTSATLAVDGSFEYVTGRLGIREADTLRVPSEFDYATQALLYLPRRVPPPTTPAFAEAAAREVIEILARSRGRAFVLFTSYAVLRTVQRFVEMALAYPILVQGTAPRTELIERFRSTPNAVLLATSSFWQGVDVVGQALSCVIIDRLPFASPADPVTAARIDAIHARGGDAFSEYQVPLAILALQQGLGRLIRHRGDRGVLAILDPRLRTRGYGRRFLDSLPPAPVTHELAAVERFFHVN